MSGRPKNLTTPTWTIPVWAPNASYPAGSDPWASTATKSPHPGAASVGFVPLAGVAAQTVNQCLYDAYTTDGSALTGMQTLRNESQAVLDFSGTLPALNFGATVSSIGAIGSAFYNVAKRSWWIFGSSANIRWSKDGGYLWTIETPGGAGTEIPDDADADASGNMVFALQQERAVFRWDGATWTKTNLGAGGVLNGDQPKVVHDPIHALWCWMGVDALGAGAGPIVYTSSDRATWTQRSHSLTGYTEDKTVLGVDKTTGRIVAISVDYTTQTTVHVATSDDGGITWTDRGTFTTTVTSATQFCLTHDGSSTWFYGIGTTGTPKSEVWKSTDGITWTKQSTQTSQCLTEISACGTLLASAVRPGQELVYSVDDGVTWQYAGRQTPATPLGVFFGAGGFLAVQTASILPGLVRAGAPNLGNVT